MEQFKEIMELFKSTTLRIVVLVLLLLATSGAYIAVQYFKVDDCRPIIKENLALHNDLVEISKLIRETRQQERVLSVHPEEPIMESSSEDGVVKDTLPTVVMAYAIPDLSSKILKIAERNIKK